MHFLLEQTLLHIMNQPTFQMLDKSLIQRPGALYCAIYLATPDVIFRSGLKKNSASTFRKSGRKVKGKKQICCSLTSLDGRETYSLE